VIGEGTDHAIGQEVAYSAPCMGDCHVLEISFIHLNSFWVADVL